MSVGPAAITELDAVIMRLDEIEKKMDTIISKSGGGDLAAAKDTMLEMRVSMNEVMLLTNRVFYIMRRAGLPEDVAQAISLMQRMITTAYALTVALIALQNATGVGGVARAGLGVMTSLLSMVGSVA